MLLPFFVVDYSKGGQGYADFSQEGGAVDSH